MQSSRRTSRALLTAREVQDMLSVDRSTVYRMAEDGRLPAIRVGRSWRFPADEIEALVAPPGSASPRSQSPEPSGPDSAEASATPPAPTARRTSRPRIPATGAPSGPAVNTDAASAAVEVAADLLGVMMVVTDMHGRPLTEVTNPSLWFSQHGTEPGVLDSCVAEWRELADYPDLTPRFQSGALGFQCARAFIREGPTLVGMVLAGGVSASDDPDRDADLYHLDEDQRSRVLSALPRIAAAISTPRPRPAVTTTAAPSPGAETKENR